jgi:hypothetical protein
VARFDWYQATVQAEVVDLKACLADLAPAGHWEHMNRAPHGYGFGDKLVDADGAACMVWWGGTHAHPHAVISGELAQPGSELLRAELPGHSVTRADACIDYAESGAYDRLQDLALTVAKDRGIRVGTAGDHLLTFKGRTCYLGAPTSHTRLRLYDKAAELRDKFAADPVRLSGVPEHLARLECQVRPQTSVAKVAAASVDPLTLMGSAAWMRELMRLVAGVELEPFEAGKVWRQSDDARAWAAVLAQYGGLFRRAQLELGSWQCVGLQIGSDLAEREEAKARLRG